MIIGIDLDNTIVHCEAVFKQETERQLGQSLDGFTREQMRSLVRERLGDPAWTHIQADVYGPLYPTCPPFDKALDIMEDIAASPHVTKLLIISHKTKSDSAGKNYALREFATTWLQKHLLPRGFIREKNIFFLETKQEKIEKIIEQKCLVFFDDLPEILEGLTQRVRHPILFSSVKHPKFLTSNWASLKRHLPHV